MKLGYVIVYVSDVAKSMEFFETAFGLTRRFLHESGTYGEFDTGSTTLSFAARELGEANFPGGVVTGIESPKPLGVEVALVTTDVVEAHRRAVEAGARELAAPLTKAWGQVVSFVQTPDGTLVELCTPMGD